MTHIEEVLLGYMKKCVYEYFGGCKKASRSVGLSKNTIQGWVYYYNTSGARGYCPRLWSLGRFFDSKGITINLHTTTTTDTNASNELTTLEKAILEAFFHAIHEKYCDDYTAAAKDIGTDIQTILMWKAYYTGKGQCGSATNLSTIAPLLEKLGVTIVERPA